MSEYLDAIHDNAAQLRDAAYELSMLAEAFYVTGNNSMSKQLGLLAEQISVAEKSIQRAVGKEINRELRETEKRTGEILNIALNSALQQCESKE